MTFFNEWEYVLLITPSVLSRRHSAVTNYNFFYHFVIVCLPKDCAFLILRERFTLCMIVFVLYLRYHLTFGLYPVCNTHYKNFLSSAFGYSAIIQFECVIALSKAIYLRMAACIVKPVLYTVCTSLISWQIPSFYVRILRKCVRSALQTEFTIRNYWINAFCSKLIWKIAI